ncbi:ABC transporter permease [Candidatus Sneabacter namystus]|uniref:Transport permease protein n=1 Tax=Candidatus Sneabacter namystus TaxID=2601646 RepID=A0A5C0UH40_9RICK|nr:ABC transporter permease [Candidatus Sneabacter namystus]QEK39418.1 hypothetical protein FZC37_00475 [Candidatus Sneabacter namystus]
MKDLIDEKLTNTECFNWQGAYTLFLRETARFLKVFNQTILSTVVSSLTLFAVLFIIHKYNNNKEIINLTACGLLLRIGLISSFDNTSSVIISKVLGYITDILFPPLSAREILSAFILAALIRALISFSIFYICILFFCNISFYSVLTASYFFFLGCISFAILGILTGIMSDTFEESSVISSYIIQPASLLSCTLYPITSMPDKIKFLAYYNPLFYLNEGFRYGCLGHCHANIKTCIIITLILPIILLPIVHIAWNKGYGIKN